MANREKGKKTIDTEHKTKDFEVRDWEKLSVKEQGYFFPTTSTKYQNYTTRERTVYRWHYAWMLVAKTQKKYITSVRVPNPNIKSEISYIDNFIERRYLSGKLDHLLHGYHTYRYWRRESMRPYLQEKEMLKDMRQELAELDPSVFEPFYPDFTVVKTKEPNYSEKNDSALLFCINNTSLVNSKTRRIFAKK